MQPLPGRLLSHQHAGASRAGDPTDSPEEGHPVLRQQEPQRHRLPDHGRPRQRSHVRGVPLDGGASAQGKRRRRCGPQGDGVWRLHYPQAGRPHSGPLRQTVSKSSLSVP